MIKWVILPNNDTSLGISWKEKLLVGPPTTCFVSPGRWAGAREDPNTHERCRVPAELPDDQGPASNPQVPRALNHQVQTGAAALTNYKFATWKVKTVRRKGPWWGIFFYSPALPLPLPFTLESLTLRWAIHRVFSILVAVLVVLRSLKARLHMRFRVQNSRYPTLHECCCREASRGLERTLSHIIWRHLSFHNVAVFCRSAARLKTRAE